MRYTAVNKLESIRVVEDRNLGIAHSQAKLGNPEQNSE